MRRLLQREVSTRWVLPLALTALLLVLLGRLLLGASYPGEAALLGLAIATWAAVAWWVGRSQERHDRLLGRLAGAGLGTVLPAVLAGLLLLDLCSGLVTDLGMVIAANALLISVLVVLAAATATALLGHRRPRLLVQNLTLSLVVLALLAVAAELVFRSVLLEPAVPRNHRGLAALVTSQWPRPVPQTKPPGSVRLLGLADSFGTVGGAQSYLYLLADQLRDSGLTCDMVNLSVAGYELPEERRMLDRFGPDYDPDLVLHGVFVGNDLWAPTGELLGRSGITVRTGEGFDRLRPSRFLLRQWLQAWYKVRADARRRHHQEARHQATGELSHEQFLAVERKRLAICSRSIAGDDPIWAANAAELDRIRAAATAIGATYVMVIHPDQAQVELPLLEQLASRYRLDANAYDLEQPQRFLTNYCRSRGLPCLDLLPILRRHGQTGGLYLLDNTHYNDAGNHLVAAQLAAFLHRHRLVPAAPPPGTAPAPATTTP